jgi:hypothetical protein
MPLPSKQKNRIYRNAIRFGLPYGLTSGAIHATETAMRAGDLMRRRRVAKAILADSPWAGFVPRDAGYRAFGVDAIPGSAEIVALCRDIVAARRAKARVLKRAEANPFDMLLNEDAFADYPQLVEFATSDALTAIASDYFGYVPRLDYIDLWISSPEKNQDDLFNSQLFHMDRMDYGILTLFIAVEDIGKDAGPFTLLPGPVTRRVVERTDYLKNYFLGSGRLRDEEVFAACDPSELVEITGPAGSGGFCDTGACLHFGSRCQTRERAVLAIRYYPPHRAVPNVYRTFGKTFRPATEAQQLLFAE